MITKDGRDVNLDELTAENYVCPQGEEMSYHAVIEIKQFNPKTGKRISTPQLQIFGKKMWETIVHSSLKKQGYDIKIVHDPRKWIEEYNQKVAAMQAAKVESAKKQREADKAAMKAEILAELKAAGMLGDAEPKKAGRPKKEQADEQE